MLINPFWAAGGGAFPASFGYEPGMGASGSSRQIIRNGDHAFSVYVNDTGAAFTITTIELMYVDSTSTVQMAVYADSAGLPNGSPLALTNSFATTLGTNIFTLATPVTVAAGARVWFAVRVASGSGGLNCLHAERSAFDRLYYVAIGAGVAFAAITTITGDGLMLPLLAKGTVPTPLPTTRGFFGYQLAEGSNQNITTIYGGEHDGYRYVNTSPDNINIDRIKLYAVNGGSGTQAQFAIYATDSLTGAPTVIRDVTDIVTLAKGENIFSFASPVGMDSGLTFYLVGRSLGGSFQQDNGSRANDGRYRYKGAGGAFTGTFGASSTYTGCIPARFYGDIY